MSIRDTSFADRTTRLDAGLDGARRDPQREFHRRFTAGDGETRKTLEALVSVLREEGLDAEVISNAELILAEVLNNVVEHAYADGRGPVEISVTILPDGLKCRVMDQGTPLPEGMVPPLHRSPAEPDSLPEGGFGWHIIRCLTSDLSYRRDAGTNCLSLHIPWTD